MSYTEGELFDQEAIQDSLANWVDTRNVLDFLNIERQPPIWHLNKQRIKTRQQLIENYTELKDAFARTPYAGYFQDEGIPFL